MPVQLDHQEFTILSHQGPFNTSIKGRNYPSRIVNADIAITGFKLQYDQPDHEVAEIEVRTKWVRNVNEVPGATHVLFEVHANLADQNADDPWSGFVQVLIIAVTE